MLKEALHYFIKIALKTTLRIYHVFPVRENRITLLNDMSYTYGDSMKYLYLYIKKKRKNRYEIIYPLKSLPRKRPEGVITVKKNTLQYYYYLLTSRVIITNAGGVSFIPKRKGQMIINTWHGGGPYKKTSTSVFQGFFYNREVQLNARQIDYMLSACEYNTVYEFLSMGIAKEKCIASGLPRNDLFFRNYQKISEKVRKYFNIEHDTKIVLYAPTFRLEADSYTGKKVRSLNALDYDRTIAALQDRFGGRWAAAVRLHPKLGGREDAYDNVIHMTQYPDVQELLCAADVLITDYSSVMWDFSLTGKPVFLYMEDLEACKRKPGFYMPPQEWPYTIAQTNEELMRNIAEFDEAAYKKLLQEHYKRSGSSEKGNACETVLNLMERNNAAKKFVPGE